MEHELKDIVPAIEENVSRAKLPDAERKCGVSQSLADGLVLLIHQFQDRVHQEGQQVERKEEGSQVLLAVSEVNARYDTPWF